MPLPDFFKRRDDSTDPPPRGAKRTKNGASAANKLAVDPAGAAALRAQVQRRLLGVAVLLLVGVVLFSFVLDRQPRPSLAEVPLTSASADKAPSPDDAPRKAQGPVAQSHPAEPSVAASADTTAERAAQAPERVQTDTAETLPTASKAPLSPGQVVEVKTEDRGQPSRLEPKPELKNEPKAAALAEGKAAPDKVSLSGEGRFVVQVGAYTDPAKLRDVRAKLLGMGLQNYTQVIKSAEGERTRVRIGPFGKKEEAQKVVERVKAAGLPTALLSL